uniref:Ig-like domain-containing protein n=1 Tax=Chrysemys picta bellii TaxID=8478 RepID=A0A8C3FJR3_CHRPI
ARILTPHRVWLLSSLTSPQSVCSHSLRYFYTGVSDPGSGIPIPQFIAVQYLDDQLVAHYDSETQQKEPRKQWVEENFRQDHWKKYTEVLKGWQQIFRVSLGTLRDRYNQSGGVHTWQLMYGCDLRDDGTTGGFRQFAYDGRDFVSFDKDTLTYTATDAGAQVTKRKWEGDKASLQRRKNYLEEICIDWLKKYVVYGKEALERKETPEVKVLRKTVSDGPTTLSCRAHGFYPRTITVSWMKNGETRDQETRQGGIVPNEDGTYHTWATIEVDPKETDLYTCRVEHESLLEPVDRAWGKNKPGSSLIPIVVGVLAALALVVGVVIGVVVWRKKSGNSSGRMRQILRLLLTPGSPRESSNTDPVSVLCDRSPGT